MTTAGIGRVGDLMAREPCSAHNRGGQPCTRLAIPGALVCLKHGGAAPQVQLAAKRFLLMEAVYTAAVRFEKAHAAGRGHDGLMNERAATACGDFTRAERALQDFEWEQVMLHLELGEDPGCYRCRATIGAYLAARESDAPW
jgi:hypothetical protein